MTLKSFPLFSFASSLLSPGFPILAWADDLVINITLAGGSVSSLKKKKIKAKLRLKNFFTFHLKFVFNRASCRFVPQPEAQAVPTQPQSSRRAPLGVGVAPARPPASFSPWGPSCPSCGAEDRAGRKNERVFRVWDPQVHWHPGTIPPTPAHSSGL